MKYSFLVQVKAVSCNITQTNISNPVSLCCFLGKVLSVHAFVYWTCKMFIKHIPWQECVKGLSGESE